MTTVILAGGNDRTAPTHFGERLSREVTKRVRDPHILICNFAKSDPVERERSSREWWQYLSKYFPGSAITVAAEDDWESQAGAADVVYLLGGRSKTLLAALPDFEKSRSLFEGKIVIGTSAGANYLADGGYSPTSQDYIQGMGIANVSVLVHYGSPEKASMQEWSEIHSKVSKKFRCPVVCISEGEFVVIEAIGAAKGRLG